ncbi:TetR/AcrR family transcriptional regulator [Streptomyces sp. NPDC002795]|uniref:TetR/AcrR family transcriptional regulator n=1 Tax=Streptomyces sp. NPDC002795 TaxID=3364665 RepID=UPI0036920F0E
MTVEQPAGPKGAAGPKGGQGARATVRGRATLAAIEAAARRFVARKGFLTMTVADITQEAGRSPASFYNYFDSKEALLEYWARDFVEEVKTRVRPAYRHGVPAQDRVLESARGHWDTYRGRLAEMVGVSQLAMVNEDFAQYWEDLCEGAVVGIAEMVARAQREGYCPGADPRLTACALVAMLNQFCYDRLANGRAEQGVDDDACVRTLAQVWYHAIYWK